MLPGDQTDKGQQLARRVEAGEVPQLGQSRNRGERVYLLDPRELLETYEHHWNISPTMPILTVARDENPAAPDKNTAKLRRWGLSGNPTQRNRGANRPLINARGEPVHKLWSFRDAFKSRRCLIPANGFILSPHHHSRPHPHTNTVVPGYHAALLQRGL